MNNVIPIKGLATGGNEQQCSDKRTNTSTHGTQSTVLQLPIVPIQQYY